MRSRNVRKSNEPSTLRSADEVWILKLYVAGTTPRSVAALANLNRICDEHLSGKSRIDVIDLLSNPLLAKGDQIIAIPTVVKQSPGLIKRIIGDLGDRERVLIDFGIFSPVKE